ncbi:hypothetical protein SAMN05421854_108373 [Amycolatopsis rubida]|uniref:Peptidase inhibitor family I36 n=1 Tax=Amycolatopsis rubida TaxID=112413 RepID=A0A1I5VJ60_9PSEU|nr:hypothetical protein SAMN05421854_108373 [Amycolatopsis rubida]
MKKTLVTLVTTCGVAALLLTLSPTANATPNPAGYRNGEILPVNLDGYIECYCNYGPTWRWKPVLEYGSIFINDWEARLADVIDYGYVYHNGVKVNLYQK